MPDEISPCAHESAGGKWADIEQDFCKTDSVLYGFRQIRRSDSRLGFLEKSAQVAETLFDCASGGETDARGKVGSAFLWSRVLPKPVGSTTNHLLLKGAIRW